MIKISQKTADTHQEKGKSFWKPSKDWHSKLCSSRDPS
jgi:hypothetical protein